jgi:hypothetical protein
MYTNTKKAESIGQYFFAWQGLSAKRLWDQVYFAML